MAQTLLVDVRLTPLLVSDYAADDLAGTIDYGLVAAVAVATAAERPYRLLERLATEIADRLWAAHGAGRVARHGAQARAAGRLAGRRGRRAGDLPAMNGTRRRRAVTHRP